MKHIFFEINFFLFLKTLFIKDKIYLVSDKKNFFVKILKKIKNNFNIIHKSTSYLILKNKNIHFYSDKIVKSCTDEIVKKYMNNKISRKKNVSNNVLETNLLVARYFYNTFSSIILKIETTNLLIKGKKKFYLQNIDSHVLEYLEKFYKNKFINVDFWNLKILILQTKLKIIFLNFFRNFFCFFFKKKIQKKKNILVNTENVISFNNELKNEFFFLDKNQSKIILRKENFFLSNSELKKNNCIILSLKDTLFLDSDRSSLNQIKNIHKIYSDKNFEGLSLKFLQINFLMIKYLPILEHYNVNFVINNSYSNDISLSFEFLKKILKFQTITYQYSFMRETNPIMSSVSDHMLIFSFYFKNIFVNKYSNPRKLIYSGYLYSSYIKTLKKKVNYFKKKFNLKNKFVITYFDENFSKSMWSLSSKKEMIKEYETLSNFVLDNKDIVIIIKTQFYKNLPRFFQKNETIKKAIKTERLVELVDDYLNIYLKNKVSLYMKRNNILPMMGSLISDISISKKYGATTSIETAILNKRNIMINEKGFKEPLDKYYKRNIEFKNIKKALKRILIYKNNIRQNKKDNLGDWSFLINKIIKIKHYDNHRFVNNIRKILKKTYD